MSKSKINVTIAGKATVQPRRPQFPPTEIRPTAAAFFLIFDCAAVEPSLTNPKSNTYKTPFHSGTGPVHLYTCKHFLNN
jgi:hypothetical protein